MNRRVGSVRAGLVGLLLVATALVAGPVAPASAADPCAPVINPIACENSKPGTDAFTWDTSGADDPSIQGFATDMSVNIGGTISFKIKTSAAYAITLYRLGYYQNNGARLMGTLTPTARTQPACLSDAATQLYDCGNWQVSASWAVPSTAVSGVYVALLHRNDTGGESHIPFIVRNDASHSDIVYQTSDPTWQAYNDYGGADFYTGAGNINRAFKISYNRPFNTRDHVSGRDYLFSNEFPVIKYLESNGYDVSYISGLDTDRAGGLLTNHKVFLDAGHDEYWSGAQRANVEAARNAGVNQAFLSGNEMYWKTRYEASIDGSGTPYRTLVCYKETWSDAKIDPSSEWTGTWRDPRFTPPSNGNRPENAVTGTLFQSNNDDLAISVPAAQGKDRFWRNTTVASLSPGSTAVLAPHTVGYESDEDLDNGSRPAGLIDVSTTTGSTPQYLYDFGNDVRPGTTTHHMTLYRAPSGALVFGAGTIQYGWALDTYHDGTTTTNDPALRQATMNLLADMGVQPTTIVSGLVAATKSTDATAPTSTITTPAAGASVANGASLTISGTAADTGGGVVAGVEISVDGGTTWHPATGTTSWTYTYLATGSGSTTWKTRATDDSGNIETPGAGRTVTVNCPCSLFGNAVPTLTAAADGADNELGVRFQASSDGVVTGLRFYKSSTNTGTHVGTLWSSAGTKLASSTFTGETASGWQSVTFSSPVSVTAGTTYTASYRAPNGHYSADPWVFSSRDWVAAPLTAPRSSGSIGNGVFASGGVFPPASNTFNGSNYYVDVLFAAAGASPPSVVSTAPASGGTGASVGAPITATFNVAVQPGTATFTVTGPGGAVAGTTALDGTGRILSFTPTANLANSTAYTATVSGAKSTGGVSMGAAATWSFTTSAPCPCTIFASSATPATVDSGDASAIELGVKFTPTISGSVTGVKFYKATTNSGTHTGSLWSSTGTRLATGTFTGESASGWQTLSFASPVAVTAGTTYVASYYAPVGHYSSTANYFSADITNGPLTVPAAGNGGYVYGTGGGFPANTFGATNYWVDLTFATGAVSGDTTPPVISAIAASAISASSATITWTTDEVSSSTVSYGTSAGSLTSTASSSGTVTSHTVILTSLNPGQQYYFKVSSADPSGNLATAPASASSFTTSACPCSLFAPSAAPSTVDSGDGSALELGVKVVPAGDGKITGVRFYKAAANTGTHVGSLWNSAGTRLATGTFSGESASGWQTLVFSSAVSVTAGTTYTASYYAPNGHYSFNGAFYTQPLVNGPLTAPSGANGTFLYGVGGGFPTNSYNSGNYWVDVTFMPATAADTTPPVISSVASSGLTTSSATISWTTDEASSSTVAYGTSSASLSSSATAAGAVTAHTVSLTGLLPGTTYYFKVTSTDPSGNSATSPVSPLSFTTVGCPCSLFSASATPATVDGGDGGSVELGVKVVPAVNGSITAVKFYKATTNTGTHTGSVWSAAGALLGTGTFSGETASGWQTLVLTTPVSVVAGTTYVVSYHAPNGHYSYNGGYFASPVVTGGLTAPSAGNGAYAYGSGNVFPSNTYNSANYWVDVVLSVP